ncbi:unnamed protein product, partial [Sphacelaria rigidula]
VLFGVTATDGLFYRYQVNMIAVLRCSEWWCHKAVVNEPEVEYFLLYMKGKSPSFTPLYYVGSGQNGQLQAGQLGPTHPAGLTNRIQSYWATSYISMTNGMRGKQM